MSIPMRDLSMAHKIAKAVNDLGGSTYYVGGYVRDKLQKRENKDIDIEVHNVTPNTLKEILSKLGTVQTQGASFGVYNLHGYGIDIAQPRTEAATGRGHKDFEVFVDPFLGTTRAAMRRDFTMNAMMENVLTGEIIDPFGGQLDLQEGVIRHVSDQTFAEDPLRVFRAAQFAARFGFTVAPETIDLMRTMDVSALPKERVWSEMEKALLKSEKPSVFFEVLKQADKLEPWFHEAAALIGCKQDPVFHPEGDAWNHTMGVLDTAAAYRDKAENPVYFMVSALCHDFGKPSVTAVGEDGKVHSYKHDSAGVPLASEFLDRINNETDLHEYVCDMVKNHMKPHSAFNQNVSVKSSNHMFDGIAHKQDICYLAVSDLSGKGDVFTDRAAKEKAFLAERLALYEKRAAEPMVTGRDLIAMGMRPSEQFSEILASSRKMHFSGVDKASVLKDIVAKNREAVNKDRADSLIAQFDTCSDNRQFE